MTSLTRKSVTPRSEAANDLISSATSGRAASASAASCNPAAHPSVRSHSRARSCSLTSLPARASSSAASSVVNRRSASRISSNRPWTRRRPTGKPGSWRLTRTIRTPAGSDRTNAEKAAADGPAWWKSSTTMTSPSANSQSLARLAAMSTLSLPSSSSRFSASTPAPGTIRWIASASAAQNRTGSSSVGVARQPGRRRAPLADPLTDDGRLAGARGADDQRRRSGHERQAFDQVRAHDERRRWLRDQEAGAGDEPLTHAVCGVLLIHDPPSITHPRVTTHHPAPPHHQGAFHQPVRVHGAPDL